MKKQEQLTSSLLMMESRQVVKRVTRYTTSYFRPPPPGPLPPPPAPLPPPPVELPAQEDSLKELEKEIQDALHIRLCEVVEQCAPRGVYTGGQASRDSPAAPSESSAPAPGRARARTSSGRPAGAPSTPRERIDYLPVRLSSLLLHNLCPPRLPAHLPVYRPLPLALRPRPATAALIRSSTPKEQH